MFLKLSLKKGELKKITSKPSDSANDKASVKARNKEIEKQNKLLDSYKTKTIDAYNNRKEYEIINAKWLKNVLFNELNKDKTPNDLIGYINYYLEERQNDIGSESIKKVKNVRNRFEEYVIAKKKTILIQQLDNQFRADFKKWILSSESYHFNTFKKQIKELVTICNYAESVTKKTLHADTSKLNTGKSMKEEPTHYIALSFKELKQIELTELKIKELDITRDWLLICSFTAQRVSDFLRYTSDNIVTLDDNNKYLDIVQSKTGNQVYIPLNDVVLRILKKYEGNFPPLYSTSKNSKRTKI